jgi:hypothetical protein
VGVEQSQLFEPLPGTKVETLIGDARSLFSVSMEQRMMKLKDVGAAVPLLPWRRGLQSPSTSSPAQATLP